MDYQADDEHPQFRVAELTADEYWLYRTFLPVFVPVTTMIVIIVVGWYFMGFGLGILYALGFPVACAIAYAILQARRNRTAARPIPIAQVVNQPRGHQAPIAQPVHPGQPPMAIPVADQQPPMAIPVSPQQPHMAIPLSPTHAPYQTGNSKGVVGAMESASKALGALLSLGLAILIFWFVLGPFDGMNEQQRHWYREGEGVAAHKVPFGYTPSNLHYSDETIYLQADLAGCPTTYKPYFKKGFEEKLKQLMREYEEKRRKEGRD